MEPSIRLPALPASTKPEGLCINTSFCYPCLSFLNGARKSRAVLGGGIPPLFTYFRGGINLLWASGLETLEIWGIKEPPSLFYLRVSFHLSSTFSQFCTAVAPVAVAFSSVYEPHLYRDILSAFFQCLYLIHGTWVLVFEANPNGLVYHLSSLFPSEFLYILARQPVNLFFCKD